MAAELKVPVVVDASIADNWTEAHYSRVAVAKWAWATLLAHALVIFLTCGSAIAQGSADPARFKQQTKSWSAMLRYVREEVLTTGISLPRVFRLRTMVADTVQEIEAARKAALDQNEAVEALLAKLGTAPKAGQPAESEDVAQERRKLVLRRSAVQDRIKLTDLLLTRGRELENLITKRQREWLTTQLGTRGPPPLTPSTWRKALPDLADIYGKVVRSPLAWWNSKPIVELRSQRSIPTIVMLAVSAVVFIGWFLRGWLLRRYGRNRKIKDPSYARRVVAAIAEGVTNGLVPALVAAVIWLMADFQDLAFGLFAELLWAVLWAVAVYFLITAFAKATLAPVRPEWRLIPFTQDAGRRLYERLRILAAIFSIDILLSVSAETIKHLPESDAVYSVVFGFAYAAAFLALLPSDLWRFEATADADKPKQVRSRRGEVRFHIVRALIAVVAVAIPVAALFGYDELSEYLRVRLMLTGLLVMLVVLLHGLLREVSVLLLDADNAVADRVRHRLGISKETGSLVRFWTVLFFDALLAVGFVVMLLLFLGMPWAELLGSLKQVFAGIQLGKYTFSLGDVFIAIFVFVVFLAVTKWLQRVLNQHVFPQTRLQLGVRDALSTGFGYLGVTLAAIIAISSVGVDLTSLTVIAGALSVGIGFGLRNLVGNFISGISLLIERPIKVGDWISVDGYEGIVKKVAVRATEIRTFQGAAVMIPNLRLIENPVTNLTHKGRTGRIDVPIGVAYGTDTQKVRELLLRIAEADGRIKDTPAPDVVFMAHGDSSLDFMLRAYTADINTRITIASDLRFEIDKAFRKAKIEIPFPQRDLHIHDLDHRRPIAKAAKSGKTTVRSSTGRLPSNEPGRKPSARG